MHVTSPSIRDIESRRELMELADRIFEGGGAALSCGLQAELFRQARPSVRAHEVYGRRVLVADGRTEIMLASWRPNVECAPHDHGHSIGHVIVLTGEFLETSYDWRGGSLQPGSQLLVRAPRLMDVNHGEIHSMRCLNTRGGLTLHLYRPQIHGMKVFDLHQRCTFTVRDDCGAWTPLPQQIESREDWGSHNG